MSRVCELTGTRPVTGNNVSHANNKTRRRWLPNLKNKTYVIPELGQSLKLTLCTRAIRTIDKQGGISAALRKAKEKNLSDRLKKVRARISRPTKKANS